MTVLAFKKITPPPSPVATKDMIRAGLAAFFRIAEHWGVSNDQARVLLGSPAKSTFFKWKRGEAKVVSATKDLATRLSYVLGIFKALELLYKHPEHADRWASQPNLVFGGQSAMERMLAGDITDLARVRDYLDSARGGW